MFPNCIAPQLKIHLKSHACHILMVTIVKAGEGLGGTVAANLAAQHPRDFDHLVSFFYVKTMIMIWGLGSLI